MLDATRIIYPQGKKEVTLGVSNKSTEPRLIQTWIDAGEENNTKAPFIVLPPVFRLDPGKGNSLRIQFTGGDLPHDQETVYWINVLEISPPPKAKIAGTQNFIQFPVRSRLKIFFRPTHLQGNPGKAISGLRWRLISGEKKDRVECYNPSPFTVSVRHIQLAPPSEMIAIKQSGMCPAKGTGTFHVSKVIPPSKGKLYFTTINDNGGFDNHEAQFHH
ncbi:molecular chaperone [Yokenella regensburgei]|uniref:fimbrial biogenesis chaperone n=1 Tax=Yokenella regensburgei TaxID=158877 RepID=UPI003F1756E1